jgi:AraC-like DNA-binding protein
VASHIAAFPPPLQTLSVGLYARGSLPRWVRDIVRETGYGRRTIDRWMSRVGLRGAAALLDTARLAHVWEPLVERGLTSNEAGALCGYTRRRMLNSHAARLVGVPPQQFANTLTRQRFVDRLSRALLEDGA